MHGSADTLVLKGEFGQAALVQDLQASFGVGLPVDETQMWYFVGDIYRSIAMRLGPATDGGKANAGTLTYYYLRRGIRELGKGDDVTPDLPLRELELLQPRRFLKRLAGQTGLKMPEHDSSWLGWAAMMLCFGAAAGLAFGIPPLPLNWPAALMTLALAFLLPLFDPGRFPAGCRTVRDLAEKAAGLNYARLRGDGAAGDAEAIWKALLGVLSSHTDTPAREITPNTRLVTGEMEPEHITYH
ncbi:hypothetical protein [Emcibacter sp. SYSU 3D8]|uniref:hypothetical protein n=1 Tax=Emcibacter sp. SYSU 3D8 TaxID=3133969 RepID=UPI0031FEA6C7